jgi:hypothetical protein
MIQMQIRARKTISVWTLLVLWLGAAPPATAQESLEEILERLDAFVQQGNYPRAMEELTWAQRALEKAHFDQVDALFPRQLQGLDARDSERHEVLGVRMLKRVYGAVSGEHLVITLTDGPGKAGFAALEQLSRLFGLHVGAEPMRIQGRSAILLAPDEQGNTVLSVQLESGAGLRFEAPGEAREKVLEGARAFDIETLDQYLAGRNPPAQSNG